MNISEQKRLIRQKINELHPAFNGKPERPISWVSTPSVVQKYFKWCQRHSFDPASLRNFCLYWGVSTPRALNGWKSSPYITNFNIAYLESLLGISHSPQEEIDLSESAITIDYWSLIAEWITDNPSLQDNPISHSYDNFDVEAGHTPGRVLKARINIKCKTETSWSEQTNNFSTFTEICVGMEPRKVRGLNHSFPAIDSISFSLNENVLYRNNFSDTPGLLENIGHLFLKDLGLTRNSLITKLQPFVYRNEEERDFSTPYNQAQRQRWSKEKRMKRRMKGLGV